MDTGTDDSGQWGGERPTSAGRRAALAGTARGSTDRWVRALTGRVPNRET